MRGYLLRTTTLAAILFTRLSVPVRAQTDAASRLVGALLGDTPMVRDLQTLTDQIGGRPTGSPANLRAFDWALERFREAGVEARKVPFQMPGLWLERSARAMVKGKGVAFNARVAALPFSTATPAAGLTAPLVDAGKGGEADFASLGGRAKGAFVLIETDELTDLDGLFGNTPRRGTSSDERSRRTRRAWCTCPRVPGTRWPATTRRSAGPTDTR